MKTTVIALAVLTGALVNDEQASSVVPVSCFRNLDGVLVCQIKKKTYTVREFQIELPKIATFGGGRSSLRLTVALDFPAGQLLDLLTTAQEAGFPDIEIVRPNNLPPELVDKLPKTELRVRLLGWTKPVDKGRKMDEQGHAP